MDAVISGYRYVTGKSPIMPAWAMGFWQSRERYKTQDEILTALRELRKRKMGVDNIVMDWQYWKLIHGEAMSLIRHVSLIRKVWLMRFMI